MEAETTQTKLAQLTGLSQQRLSQLQRQHVFARGDPLVAANQKIIRHLGDLKGGHRSEGGLDLIHERARLSQFQSQKVALEVQEMMARTLPLDVVKDILAVQNSTVRNRCLGIANALKAKHPDLPTKYLLSLKEIVTEVLTDLSHVRFPVDLDERIKQFFRNLLTATESDGDGVGG